MYSEFNIGQLIGTRSFTGFISNNNNQDVRSFQLANTQNVNFSLTNLVADADLQIIRDANNNGFIDVGEQVVAQSIRGSSADESITRILQAGNYLIDVSQYSGNTSYTLRVSDADPSNLLVNEFSLGTLNGARAFDGAVGNSDTADIYQFNLNQTSDLNVSLAGLSQDADIRIIRDSNNNGIVDTGEVVAISQRSFNFDEAISLESLAAGNYFAEVYQFDGDTHYRFDISATASNNAFSNRDLTGRFSFVDAPDIRYGNDFGQVSFQVSNQGSQFSSGPVTVSLYASTDATYDSNDELLTSQTLNISLGQGQSQFYNLAFDAPTVVAPGSYYLLARVDSGNAIAESNEGNNVISQHVSAPGTDVVLDWNATLLNAIQTVATAPPLAARNQAIVHAAIYDAVNAIDQSYDPYLVSLSPSFVAGASIEAAAAAAAHRTLSDLYPTLSSTFDAQLERSLAEIADGTAEDRGVFVGQFVADHILAERFVDGSGSAQTPFTLGTGLGGYQPTRADGLALLPNWGQVAPFSIPNATAFRLGGPPQFGSSQYTAELNEVQAFGGLNSTVRTADQTQIAQFWALDRADTFRPPGHWNQIAQTVALQEGTSVVENARLFALLNIAQADAGIVAWDNKYFYDQLRPVTAIHQADFDGTSLTVGDPEWQSFLATPPFPDYVSGHSTFGAAAAEVLTYFFGDNYEFTATSQELPGVYRSFGSFYDAAAENGISRIYGGVHVQSANLDGLAAGYAVADYVIQNTLV